MNAQLNPEDQAGANLAKLQLLDPEGHAQPGVTLPDVELATQLFRDMVRTRSFDEMEQWGDDLSSFDLVVSLSPASQRRALELTRVFHLEVIYWPIMDPTGLGETRDAKLAAYRQTRDQIISHLTARWGPPKEDAT